jgi:hypothetical protein
MIDCPYCAGSGKVKSRPIPVALTPLQRRIYELLAAVPIGVSIDAVVNRVYVDGAPPNARNSVWVTIINANKRLEPFQQRIIAKRGWCSLKTI